jgi:GT2 family glycosyltransferase
VPIASGACLPEISAVICTYTDERWELLLRAVASLETQLHPIREVVVVVDHNEPLLERIRRELPSVLAVANDGPQGLSGARNAGTAASSSEIVASVDDDAMLAPDWTLRVAEDFLDPLVVAVGSAIAPEWEGEEPGWFPPEFYWVVGCTYRGVPITRKEIRNPLGAAMALRREVLHQVGGYRSELGRLNKRPLGCEETELCVRVRQNDPLALIIQDPRARASHYVPAERKRWPYFRSRCFSEGLSKATVSRAVGSTDGLSTERSYVTRTLPRGAWNGIMAGLGGDFGGFGRAAAIVAGLSWTVAGFVVGRLHPQNGPGKRSAAVSAS